MKDIKTSHFGFRPVIALDTIPGTDELFLAQVPSEVGARYRYLGVINKDWFEVVPFGDLRGYEGVRVVNKNTIIFDYVSIQGVDNVHDDIHGSILVTKVNNAFEPVFYSNAARIRVTGSMLIGACFDEEPNWVDHKLVATFIHEYHYDEHGARIGRVIHCREGEFDNGRFQDVFESEVNSYLQLELKNKNKEEK